MWLEIKWAAWVDAPDREKARFSLDPCQHIDEERASAFPRIMVRSTVACHPASLPPAKATLPISWAVSSILVSHPSKLPCVHAQS